MKIRLRKDGKPYANDLKRAKRELKQNFDRANPETLPKPLKGYYNQLKAAKERILVRNPETGKILGGKIRTKVLQELKTASEFSGIPIKDLLKPENYEAVFNSAISEKISFSGTLPQIEKYLQMGYTYGAQINDENGIIKSSVEEVYSIIVRVLQILTQYGYFQAFWSGLIEADGKVTIYIPLFLFDLINGEDMSDEDLAIEISESARKKIFNAIKSNDKRKK